MQFYPHRTVEEQAERLPEQLRAAYENSQIDRITISDGASEIEVTGYAEYSYLEEKSYKTQPVRTMDGVIHDIDEYATFLTPRLVIKYSMMNINDYRALMTMLNGRKNGFTVTCYDVVSNSRVTNQMYVAPPSMPVIYQQYLIALGIKEYVIELIGTGAPPNFSTGEMMFVLNNVAKTIFRGATWKDWVNTQSEFSIIYDKYYEQQVVADTKNGVAVYYDNFFVHPNEYIIENGLYTYQDL